MEIKFKKHVGGGMFTAGLSAVGNLVGMGIGIAETIKANKSLKKLEKERPEMSVPSEMYKNLDAAEQTFQAQKENSAAALNTGAGVLLRDQRNAGMLTNMIQQNNRNVNENAFAKLLNQQRVYNEIGRIKHENMATDLTTWKEAVAIANARRTAGIKTAFEKGIGGLSNIGDFNAEGGFKGWGGGGASDTSQAYSDAAMNRYDGGRVNIIKGQFKGKEGEEKDPLMLVDSKGVPAKDVNGGVITMTRGESTYVFTPEQHKVFQKAISGDKVAQAAMAKVFNKKNFS